MSLPPTSALLPSDKLSSEAASQLATSQTNDANRPADETAWIHPVATTALAVSALMLSEQHGGDLSASGDSAMYESAYQGDLSELLIHSMHWLAKQQRHDGGWGLSIEPALPESSSQESSTDHSSSLATTLLARAAFRLTGVPAAYPDLTERMDAFSTPTQGLERLHSSEAAASNTLLFVQGCCALAEVVDIHFLPCVPLETATFSSLDLSRGTGYWSHSMGYWASRGPSLPAVVALGLAGCKLHPSRNPLTRWRRSNASGRASDWLSRQQSNDGGFAGSIAATSLVIMSLASIGQSSTSLIRRGVEFLLSSVQVDGNWPSDLPPTPEAKASPARQTVATT